MSYSESLYASLKSALEQSNLICEADEIHGVITGQLCGGQPMDGRSWMPLLQDLVNEGSPFHGESFELVEKVYHLSCQQLIDPDYSFQPELEAEDAPLDERVNSLARWVQGFLAGFGSVKQDLTEGGDDIEECLKDMTAIAQLELDDDEMNAAEETEEALSELHEYVRVSAMMIFSQFGNLPETPDEEQKLH